MENPFVDQKRSRKLRLIVTAGILIAIFAGTVFAANWIFGNTVSVSVGAYSFLDSMIVDDATPYQYQEITFSGTLYYDGSPVGSGLSVSLFKDAVTIDSTSTDANGDFSFVYNATTLGDFDFKPGYLPS